MKALELEVAKLRAKDVAHDEEIRKYKGTIRFLSDLLVSNNVPIAGQLPQVPINSPLAMIEVAGAADDPTIRAHMPVFDAAAPFPFQKDSDSSATSQTTQLPTPISAEQQHLPSFEPMTVDMPTAVHHPYGLDSSQVGVDFVLALEHPCLWHAQNPNPELGVDSGTGHQLMLINPIMVRSPRRQGLKVGVAPSQGPLPQGTKWSVPALELEKLLSFSEGLDLDGELTPVQAWQRIRLHSKFINLTPTGLETLRESLLSMVQCYGWVSFVFSSGSIEYLTEWYRFGAVIDEAYFEEMLKQTFGA